MTTSFLFAHGLNEKNCLSLSLDDKGAVSDSLMYRSFDEIARWKKPRILIVPTKFFSIQTLALPWISEKKARTAIPFALEEHLAQPVTDLHFAFDRAFHEEGHYLITVGDKAYLSSLIALFKQHNITLDKITLDWFALDSNEILITEENILARTSQFQGLLDIDLASPIFEHSSNSIAIPRIFCSNVCKAWTEERQFSYTEISQEIEIWIAQRLQQRKTINLCQGEFQPKYLIKTTMRYYLGASAVLLVWLFSFLGIHLGQIPSLNQKIAQADTEIGNIYKKFFPQAKQIINPKFRINQLLKTHQDKANINFWLLLNLLAKNSQDEAVTFEKIRFQNQTFFVTFSVKNFEELENFQNRLNQSKAKIKQTQATTHQEKILGTLELTL